VLFRSLTIEREPCEDGRSAVGVTGTFEVGAHILIHRCEMVTHTRGGDVCSSASCDQLDPALAQVDGPYRQRGEGWCSREQHSTCGGNGSGAREECSARDRSLRPTRFAHLALPGQRSPAGAAHIQAVIRTQTNDHAKGTDARTGDSCG